MIQARDAFLELGLYDFLIEFILKLDLGKGRFANFLEIGCGSAYYLDKMAKSLSIKEVYGSDISKEAIKFCAKKYKNYHFSVDNSFDLNFRDNCFDLILSIFSPFKNSEIERILAKKGCFVLVRQNTGHLKEIYKQVGMPEKEKSAVIFENLKLVKSFDLKKRIKVSDEQLQLLIAMSPLAWKIDQEAISPKAIKQITVSFKIAIYS
ncbi:methyltransferase domain-containing protein [Candidatus Peregrinibacteria bacterium]|nr:methyltransferase domain-containing protein [Candidatus Peregrinibacteria bacterium]